MEQSERRLQRNRKFSVETRLKELSYLPVKVQEVRKSLVRGTQREQQYQWFLLRMCRKDGVLKPEMEDKQKEVGLRQEKWLWEQWTCLYLMLCQCPHCDACYHLNIKPAASQHFLHYQESVYIYLIHCRVRFINTVSCGSWLLKRKERKKHKLTSSPPSFPEERLHLGNVQKIPFQTSSTETLSSGFLVPISEQIQDSETLKEIQKIHRALYWACLLASFPSTACRTKQLISGCIWLCK